MVKRLAALFGLALAIASTSVVACGDVVKGGSGTDSGQSGTTTTTQSGT